MSIFKVGDRVRLRDIPSVYRGYWGSKGTVAEIISRMSDELRVLFDKEDPYGSKVDGHGPQHVWANQIEHILSRQMDLFHE